jgi:hypothetical protein
MARDIELARLKKQAKADKSANKEFADSKPLDAILA